MTIHAYSDHGNCDHLRLFVAVIYRLYNSRMNFNLFFLQELAEPKTETPKEGYIGAYIFNYSFVIFAGHFMCYKAVDIPIFENRSTSV